MIQKGKRQQGIPFIINGGEAQKLEKVPLNENLFQEEWLQKTIHTNPDILPISDFDDNFYPPIALGREIETKVGRIDNLYISPTGYLTIVETKLWRNQDAKREVVAQILDYAKEIATWSFSMLDESIKKAHSKQQGIIELLNDIEEFDEQRLIDNTERNLKRGRFLLLIVGEGIRENVEDMVNYLQEFAHLQFTLGLVELQVYKSPKSETEWLVIPNVITRTKEITRAIIKIENNSDSIVTIAKTDFIENNSPQINASRTTLTEDDFFDQLRENTDAESEHIAKNILQMSKDKGFYIDWQQNGCTIKFTPIGCESRISLYRITRGGQFSLGKWEKDDSFITIGVDSKHSEIYAKNTAEIFGASYSRFRHKWDEPILIKQTNKGFDKFIKEVDILIKKINEEIEKKAE